MAGWVCRSESDLSINIKKATNIGIYSLLLRAFPVDV